MADFDELFQLPPLEPLRPANRDSAVLACAPPASAQIVRPLPELTTFSRRADGHQPPSAPTAARQQQQQQQHAPNNQQQQQRLLSARPAVAAPRGATQHHLPAPAPATQHQHHAKQLAQQGKPMARQPTLQQLFARAQCAGGRSKAETAQLYVPGAAGGAGGHSGKENRKALGLAEPWDELQERGAGKVMVWKMDEVNDVHQGEKAGDSGSVEQQSSEEELDDEDGDEDSSSAGEEDSEYHVSSEGSEEQEGDEDEDEEYGQGRGRSGKGKAGGVTGARKRRAPVGGGRGRTQTHAVMPVTIDGSVDPDAEQRGSRPPPLPKALLTVPSDAGRKPNAKPAIGGEASKVNSKAQNARPRAPDASVQSDGDNKGGIPLSLSAPALKQSAGKAVLLQLPREFDVEGDEGVVGRCCAVPGGPSYHKQQALDLKGDLYRLGSPQPLSGTCMVVKFTGRAGAQQAQVVQLLDEVVVASVDQDVAMLMHGDGGTLAYGRGWSDSDEEVDEADGGQAEEAGAELPGSKPAVKKKRVAATATKGRRTAGAKKPKAKKHKHAGKKG